MGCGADGVGALWRGGGGGREGAVQTRGGCLQSFTISPAAALALFWGG